MPRLLTKFFGERDYSPEAVFHFEAGIPGFEDQTAFLFLEQPHAHPLVFMQSLTDSSLCFIAIPVSAAEPNYRLSLSSEDRQSLGLSSSQEPQMGVEVLCLTLVSAVGNAQPTVNLVSPVVMNLQNRRGLQAIQDDSPYSWRHLLVAREGISPC